MKVLIDYQTLRNLCLAAASARGALSAVHDSERAFTRNQTIANTMRELEAAIDAAREFEHAEEA